MLFKRANGKSQLRNVDRIFVVVVVICLSASPLWAPPPREYDGGTGEPGDPYRIRKAEHLQALGGNPSHWGKHFKLTGNINLSGFTGADFNIIGSGFSSPFSGTFDGDGYKIFNFTYDCAGEDTIGLFGVVDGANAEIRDLGLVNPDVNADTGDYVGSLVGILWEGKIIGCYSSDGSVLGGRYVGGLVGCSTRDGLVRNCYSTSSVSGTSFDAGGLVGLNFGQISDSYSAGDVLGNSWVGGLVGCNEEGVISSCYSCGTVSGDGDSTGGLVGNNREGGEIIDCYSRGDVSGTSNVGGLVGKNYDGTIVDSFWDTDTSGLSDMCGDECCGGSGCDNVNGKTTSEMQIEDTYVNAGWDFATPIWIMCDCPNYPRLSWQGCGARYVDAVNGDDNNDGLSEDSAFATIQKGIDSALDSDTVIVADGTYTGPGNRDIDFKCKAITVRSENGPESCTIDCNGTSADPHRGFDFHSGEDANSLLEGFSIVNGKVTFGGGIYLRGSSPTINNCVISNNHAANGGAICCHSGSRAIIRNCMISNNRSSAVGGSIYSGQLTFINCLICGNTGTQGGCSYRSSSTFINCTITNNRASKGGGIMCWESDAYIINCILWGNLPQQILEGYDGSAFVKFSDVQGGWTGEGNIDDNPRFASGPLGDYYLSQIAAGQSSASPCVDTGSDLASVFGLDRFTTRTDQIWDAGIVDMGYHYIPPNTEPVACIVGGDKTVEVGSDCEAKITLDGSCSSDGDSTPGTNDDINDFDWYEVIDVCDPNSDIFLGSGEIIECNLPLGEHTIILEVTDKAGAFDVNEVTITVEDTTPPEFSLSVEPSVLWPANHKMVEITPFWEVSDNCDEWPEVTLVGITANGDVAAEDDIQIGDEGIWLRAERSGTGSGRVYTITYQAVDDSGNVTQNSAAVAVPHDKRKSR